MPTSHFSRTSPEAYGHGGHGRVAGLAGLLVGLLGLYPHLRWSLELKQVAWFYNSYDEGYYGWVSMHELAFNRGLSNVVMHVLYFASGSNAQLAMILADFFLPCGVMLACCYLVRPLFSSALAMAAGALTILVSAECLALRSTSIPYNQLHMLLQEKVVPLTGGAAGIFQLENQTSTFWIFRTPEPQISWIVMFLALGMALRVVLSPVVSLRQGCGLALASFVAGMGYLFCALSVGGAFLLFAVLAARSHFHRACVLGISGVLCLGVCMGSSLWSARQWGGDSLVFPSHLPVVTIGTLLGLCGAGAAVLRARSARQFTPFLWFALALGLTPFCMANQQWATGHMIYLLNFENFGFAQLAALAGLIVISPLSHLAPEPSLDLTIHRPSFAQRFLLPGIVVLLLGGMLVRSQLLSYRGYLETNCVAKSYATTIQAIPHEGSLIVCEDFFATDILTVLLGTPPDFLIARDMIFTDLITRLKNPQDLPANGAKPRLALFHYLALTGVTPGEFSRRFDAVTDPTNPNWEDRFLLGGFLYHGADFWAPLTHGRDIKLVWIKAQKPRIVDAYTQFLAEGETSGRPILFIMRQDHPSPTFLAAHQARPIDVPTVPLLIPMKAFRLEARSAPKTIR